MPTDRDYSPSRIHLDLGDAFYDVVAPATFPRHDLRYRNDLAAQTVGLASLTDDEWIDHFGRFTPLPGSLPAPLALRYHGHQFQSYNPNLGDGRGFLFAQVSESGSGRVLDLATKGSGQTPWSRNGDGRLTLKGGVREVLAAEMLAALGVDTSKAFSLIETGESLQRNDEPSPTRSAVLVRLSHSHIRIGTFQRVAFLGDHDSLDRLIDHTIRRYYPNLAAIEGPARTVALLQAVVEKVAHTGARWLAAGFVHGVLNSDNINITGESFDYGPWRFTPTFDMKFTAAYFDHYGLYAFGQQPSALQWNLARLAECLATSVDAAELAKAQATFAPALQAEFATAMLERLGLTPRGAPHDAALLRAMLEFLTGSGAEIERTLFDWYGGEASAERAKRSPAASLYDTDLFRAVRRAWAAHEPVRAPATWPAYFAQPAPCTMLIDEVESIWSAIAEHDDWSPFHRKIEDIALMGAAYRPATRR